MLSPTEEPAGFTLTAWPPADATPLEPPPSTSRPKPSGYAYGPAFQGLRQAWRSGEEIYAEVELADREREDAAHHGLHPALLDAALQAYGLAGTGQRDTRILLPFSWNGVTLHASGAQRLRVRLTPAGPDTVTVLLPTTTATPSCGPTSSSCAPSPPTSSPTTATPPATRCSPSTGRP
ncbi:Polyketide synthase OS=Streptomyces fumanus OX=67302 GN=GCM10018772_62350 PE=4 SV=1 [Streptomyces fumanus]